MSRSPGPESARELWIDALARLHLAAVAARQPETAQRLRRLGAAT